MVVVRLVANIEGFSVDDDDDVDDIDVDEDDVAAVVVAAVVVVAVVVVVVIVVGADSNVFLMTSITAICAAITSF